MPFRLLACLMVATATSARSVESQLPSGIAVVAFEDVGSYGQDQEDFAALERGIPGMLISELAWHPDATLADRRDTQVLWDKQNLGETGRLNTATAANIGRLIGVRYVVFGTFLDLYGEFRVDARIVDVETGEIVQVASANDDREHLFRLLQAIAGEILVDIGLAPLASDIEAMRTGRNVPTDALTLYSRALLYQDRGDPRRAAEFYRQALEVLPNYTEAAEGLRRLGPS